MTTGLSSVSGDVLSAINDMIGREIILETVDEKRFTGVLSAVSEEMSFGMRYVVEITEENKNNLLRAEEETVEKMTFAFTDIVNFVYMTQDDKSSQHLVSKFVTDRQYHGDAPTDFEDLQEWNGGDEDDGIGGSIEDEAPTGANQQARRNTHNSGTGWSVDDMFAVNQKMNVVSTFKDDLTQYTTVEVIGTDEDRARAERLAREIESNSSSKFMANLENDDDERDLDKITKQEDFDSNSQRRVKGNNSYSQQTQQRRNPNVAPNGQPVNRRAEGLRGDRRNSGGSSANNSRYNAPNQSMSYQQQQPHQQNQGQKGQYTNRRQNEEHRENDWHMAKGKGQNQGHDHSFRQQQKQMLDPRPSPKQEGEKGQGSGSRVTELKNWGNEFSIATIPKEQSPALGSTPPTSQGNSSSAWNRGPPSSLVAKGPAESTPPPAEAEASSSKSTAQKKDDLPPSTSGDDNNDVEEKNDEADNVSVTDASETSSVNTSKLFKFNINAPEFKPRVTPSTPTPTTPNGPVHPPQPQQFVQQEYTQPMVPQGGPQQVQMGMVHMGPGGVPTNQNHPIVMWTGGQQGYPVSQQFPMQPMMTGIPGQMYGAAANAPVTVQQQANMNQQIPTSAASGNDGRQYIQRREGDNQQCYYQFPQSQMMQVPQQFYQPQFQGQIQQTYPVKLMQPQGQQGQYPQQRYQQQQVFVHQQGQGPQQRYQGSQQQHNQFAGDQQPQSHPNSQPTTPGPRADANGPKMQQQYSQNGNNGMHREPEGGSNASLSGSASSQSGQRSGSPSNNSGQPHQQVQQHQQGPPQGGPPHGGPPQAPIVGVPHQQPFMVMNQMHQQFQGQYYQPQMYYQMMQPVQMQQQQHNQQSVMGERSDTGFPATSYFDYRTMPNYQQNQQMHGSQMPRQNSIPQTNHGVNSSSQQAPPNGPPQQTGSPREHQQQTQVQSAQ